MEQPTTKEWKASPREDVKDEMAHLALIGNKGFYPPPTIQDGVDLLDYRSTVTGKTAYDRWLELTGTVKMAGMNIHEMLAGEIASRAEGFPVLLDLGRDFRVERPGLCRVLCAE